VKVNSLGKWKTALQMTSMSILLFCKDQTGWLEGQLEGETEATHNQQGHWCMQDATLWQIVTLESVGLSEFYLFGQQQSYLK
jgi:hypothetical protein